MSHNNQKKIAVVNDFCGFGRCSLAVSLPIISAMGIQCCPVPTAIFSNHTGFESFFSSDFTDKLDAYIDEWVKLDLHFDGILTGYLASEAQIDIVKDFLNKFKKSDNVTIVDPVMGDGGRLYTSYAGGLAKKMAELLSFADIITPNLTEACFLTDAPYKTDMSKCELLSMCERLCEMGPESIVISGLERGDMLENFIYIKGIAPVSVYEGRVGECRSGTGDVFASVIASDVISGKSLEDAVRHASGFVARTLKRTAELGIPRTDGVCFEEFLREI